MTTAYSRTLTWGTHRLELGDHTRVMGIINITPDSFSDGGLFFSYEKAVAHGEKLAEEGADILDIGGESTRPYSEAISEDEEMRRVIPVIDTLCRRVSVPISIDTTKSTVARRALDAGASIINDISALRADPELGDVAAAYDVPIVLMHMLGTPKTMQNAPRYEHLIEEIKAFLQDAAQRAMEKNISRSKIIIDPGIGFGKSLDHNLQLLTHLKEFAALDFPILVGPSRKAFIRNLLRGQAAREIDPLCPEVETGTQAAVAAAALNGAHIVRVHHVAATCATLKIINALKTLKTGERKDTSHHAVCH